MDINKKVSIEVDIIPRIRQLGAQLRAEIGGLGGPLTPMAGMLPPSMPFFPSARSGPPSAYGSTIGYPPPFHPSQFARTAFMPPPSSLFASNVDPATGGAIGGRYGPNRPSQFDDVRRTLRDLSQTAGGLSQPLGVMTRDLGDFGEVINAIAFQLGDIRDKGGGFKEFMKSPSGLAVGVMAGAGLMAIGGRMASAGGVGGAIGGAAFGAAGGAMAGVSLAASMGRSMGMGGGIGAIVGAAIPLIGSFFSAISSNVQSLKSAAEVAREAAQAEEQLTRRRTEAVSRIFASEDIMHSIRRGGEATREGLSTLFPVSGTFGGRGGLTHRLAMAPMEERAGIIGSEARTAREELEFRRSPFGGVFGGGPGSPSFRAIEARSRFLDAAEARGIPGVTRPMDMGGASFGGATSIWDRMAMALAERGSPMERTAVAVEGIRDALRAAIAGVAPAPGP